LGTDEADALRAVSALALVGAHHTAISRLQLLVSLRIDSAKENFELAASEVNPPQATVSLHPMKKPNRILFTSLVPVFAFLISAAPLSVRAADEKPDLGPPPAAEETKAIDELGKRGVFASPIAAGYNWRSINFRGADKPDAELYGQLKSIPSIVELDLAGSKFTPADLANISGLQNLKKLNLASSSVTDDREAPQARMAESFFHRRHRCRPRSRRGDQDAEEGLSVRNQGYGRRSGEAEGSVAHAESRPRLG